VSSSLCRSATVSSRDCGRTQRNSAQAHRTSTACLPNCSPRTRLPRSKRRRIHRADVVVSSWYSSPGHPNWDVAFTISGYPSAPDSVFRLVRQLQSQCECDWLELEHASRNACELHCLASCADLRTIFVKEWKWQIRHEEHRMRGKQPSGHSKQLRRKLHSCQKSQRSRMRKNSFRCASIETFLSIFRSKGLAGRSA
jgi:hypothetical protein